VKVENLDMTYRTEDGTEVHARKDINFSMDEGNLVVVGPSSS
jgi:ABC-type oligopeptide transport system ATPase subunit